MTSHKEGEAYQATGTLRDPPGLTPTGDRYADTPDPKAPIPNPEPTTALQGRTAARSPTGPSGRPPQPSWPAAAVLTSSADQAATRPEGLHPRPGVGTFVTATLADDSLAAHGLLRQELRRWLARARRAGLDEESIEALFMTRVRNAAEEDMA